MPRRKTSPSDRLIDAALALAAERAWSDISLAEIAAEAKLPLSQVYPEFPSKGAILDAFSRRIDQAVLAEEEAEAADLDGIGARDRLFDVIMRRFDALQPHRAAIASIIYDEMRSPPDALARLLRLARSMSWMLEAAGIGSGGLAGALRVKGLMAVYLATLRVWLRDDSGDMARTMSALDRQLRRAESLLAALQRGREGRGFRGRAAEDRDGGEAAATS